MNISLALSGMKQKSILIGLTLFIPTIMVFIASSKILNSIIENIYIVALFSIVFSFIILLLDIGLIATYRPDRKILIIFRFLVAICIGFIIAHPIVLLIFDDEIQTKIAQKRIHEMDAIREGYSTQRKEIEEQLENAKKQQEDALKSSKIEIDEFQGIYSTQIPNQEISNPNPQLERYNRLKQEIQAKINKLNADENSKNGELSKKRNDLADEIRGEGRTNKSGWGPIAATLQSDIDRLNNRLVALKNQLVRQIKVPHPRANARQFIIKINSMYS